MPKVSKITTMLFTAFGRTKNSLWDCNIEQMPSPVVKQYISSAEMILRNKSCRVLKLPLFSAVARCTT